MPLIDSPHWNLKDGVCEKHCLPELPCQQCLAEHDADMTVQLTEADRDVLDFETETTVRDLLPAKDGDWLLERLVV